MFLLDTDICSYAAQPSYHALRRRLIAIRPELLAVSAITHAEVLFGLENRQVGRTRRAAVDNVFASLQILDWPAAAAPIYGYTRAGLMRRGTPIGDRDIMIAAHAIAIDATLITNNLQHFDRIGPPLRLENWL